MDRHESFYFASETGHLIKFDLVPRGEYALPKQPAQKSKRPRSVSMDCEIEASMQRVWLVDLLYLFGISWGFPFFFSSPLLVI